MTKQTKRVCHVCSAHPVDDARVFQRACVSLVAAGYEVHLIGTSDRPAPYVECNVHVHPIPRVASSRARLRRRSEVAALAAQIAPDLLHVHEPELLGATLAVAGRRPVIWDAHESYLDVLANREWIPGVLRPSVRFAWDRLERRMVRRCAAIIGATEGVAERYYPLHHSVHVIANYPDLSEWQAGFQRLPEARGCVFTGTLAPNRGIFEVLRALRVLRQRGHDMPLAIAGPAGDGGSNGQPGFMDRVFATAAELGVHDLVTYHGHLARNQVASIIAAASIGLVPHLPGGNNAVAWPVKMFEYMAAGLPIVYSDLRSHQQIAGSAGAGIAVDVSDAESFADAIERLDRDAQMAAELGAAGQRAVRERFNWHVESAKLVSLYAALLDGTGDAARRTECEV